MRPYQGFVWGCALALLSVGSGPVHAGWNNVFQVCCNSCGGSAPVVATYADPCPPPCPPQQTCTTRYVQRSYYQPVTTYRTSYYVEPVTTYRTSYYYEPVTSYRYSCYYDPCTCRYQSVATPVTSYALRSRCCPVTSYLQRTCTTPVTTYQQAFYYEPVTTCCTTSVGAAVAAPPNGAAVVPGTAPATPAPPATTESRDDSRMPPLPPGTEERRDVTPPANTDRLKPRESYMPPVESSFRNPARKPAVRPDRIASRVAANLEGRVVGGDRQPLSSARILLVSAENKGDQHTLTADRDGRFETRLVSGGWLVYTYDSRGKPVFSRRVEVPNGRGVSMTLTQR